jgi:hypothetical protein
VAQDEDFGYELAMDFGLDSGNEGGGGRICWVRRLAEEDDHSFADVFPSDAAEGKGCGLSG